MCLAVPVKVLEVKDSTALVELGGIARRVSIMLVPDTQAGDYVLLHAGFAIEKLNEDEAMETLRLFAELAEAEEAS
jgi:hydrogenase expression/formation protein HypC